jgi:uncharacterized protein (DUF2267 family)
MQYNEFINKVQQKANLNDSNEAARLVEVVLAALGERLYRTERDDLGSQLPVELKQALFTEQPPENTRDDVRRFSVEEFYNRVRARTGAGYPDAVQQAKAVMAVLQDAVSAGEIADMMNTLPDEYRELL